MSSLIVALVGAARGRTATFAGVAFVDGFSPEMSSAEAVRVAERIAAEGTAGAVAFDPHDGEQFEQIAAQLQRPLEVCPALAPALEAGSTASEPPQADVPERGGRMLRAGRGDTP